MNPVEQFYDAFVQYILMPFVMVALYGAILVFASMAGHVLAGLL